MNTPDRSVRAPWQRDRVGGSPNGSRRPSVQGSRTTGSGRRDPTSSRPGSDRTTARKSSDAPDTSDRPRSRTAGNRSDRSPPPKPSSPSRAVDGPHVEPFLNRRITRCTRRPALTFVEPVASPLTPRLLPVPARHRAIQRLTSRDAVAIGRFADRVHR